MAEHITEQDHAGYGHHHLLAVGGFVKTYSPCQGTGSCDRTHCCGIPLTVYSTARLAEPRGPLRGFRSWMLKGTPPADMDARRGAGGSPDQWKSRVEIWDSIRT